MRFKKFISALTSVAMTATWLISAAPFTTSAYDSVVEKKTNMSLTLEAEKPSFTMDEVREGNAKTTVSLYAKDFSDDEKISVIIAGFGTSDKRIKISNIRFPDNMGLSKEAIKGNEDYAAANLRFNVDSSDEGCNFLIQCVDQLRTMVAEDLTRPIVQFDASFDPSMEEGYYEINFDNKTTPITVQTGYEFRDEGSITDWEAPYGMLITSYDESARSKAKPVTITLGTPAPTEPVSDATEEQPTEGTIYDGKVLLSADSVTAQLGEKAEVGVYADTNGSSFVEIEFKLAYDSKALELADVKPVGILSEKTIVNPNTGAVIVQGINAPIECDPAKPLVIFTFKFTENTVPGKIYELNFTGVNGSSTPLAMKSKGQGGEPDVYFEVVTAPGRIEVPEQSETVVTTPAVTETVTTETAATETAATESAATETIPAATEEPTIDDKYYEGQVLLHADIVKAQLGEKAEVGVYADTNGSSFVGLEFKLAYDSRALELAEVKPVGILSEKTVVNPDTGAVVINSDASLTKLECDPAKPLVIYTFAFSENAVPGKIYELNFTGVNGSSTPIAMKTKGQGDDPDVYFKVVTYSGKIELEAEQTTVVTAPETTEPASSASETQSAESIVTTIVTVPVSTNAETTAAETEATTAATDTTTITTEAVTAVDTTAMPAETTVLTTAEIPVETTIITTTVIPVVTTIITTTAAPVETTAATTVTEATAATETETTTTTTATAIAATSSAAAATTVYYEPVVTKVNAAVKAEVIENLEEGEELPIEQEGCSFVFDADSVANIKEQLGEDKDIVLDYGVVSKDDIENEAVLEVIEEYDAVLSFELKDSDGNKIEFGSENGGKVTIIVPYNAPVDAEIVEVYYISEDGTAEKMENAYYDPAAKTIRFDTTHFSYYAVKAVDESGEAVKKPETSLPQTGNNTPDILIVVLSSVMLAVSGAFVMMKSNVVRRRKEAE